MAEKEKAPRSLSDIFTYDGHAKVSMNVDALNFCNNMDTYCGTYEEFHRTLTMIYKKIASDS